MARVLLVDDDRSVLEVLGAVLKANGHETIQMLGGEKAREVIESDIEFDLMISDVRMSPVDGIQLLEMAHKRLPDLPVIMLTAYGQVETAARALKLGAFDYITKPFNPEELIFTVTKAIEHAAERTAGGASRIPEPVCRFGDIVAESPAMKSVCDTIRRAAPLDIPMLICGEPGCGKRHIARIIHMEGKRSGREMQALDCGMLPEPVLELLIFGHVAGAEGTTGGDRKGMLESAGGGTLVLNEIGRLPESLQARLAESLIARESRRVGSKEGISIDTRLIAVSRVPLVEFRENGLIEKRLYSLLSVLPLEIPPLRARAEDIVPLAYHFLRRNSGPESPVPRLDETAVAVLGSFPWPNNVRELAYAVKYAAGNAKDGIITRESFPPAIAATETRPRRKSADGIDDSTRGKSAKAFIEAKKKQYIDQIRRLKT